MPRWTSFLFVAAALLACKGSRVKTKGCAQDSDCGSPAAAWRCDASTGACFCRTDPACEPREFCNLAGFCQDRAGCERNADCLDPNLFCDTTNGTCLPKGRCTIDLHCDAGKVCDVAKSTCVDGCRSHGDCATSSCFCGAAPCACEGKTQEERTRCAIGQCDSFKCAEDKFCRGGELCSGADPQDGSQPYTCVSDFDPDQRPYCSACSFGAGLNTCGNGPHYCLVDTQRPGSYFCGADCSQGQRCPRGFACQDVIVVSRQWECSPSQSVPCAANPALPCTDDGQCKRGGRCVKAPGETVGGCAGACRLDEGDRKAYCSCQVDTDCLQDTCSNTRCTITKLPCTTDDNCRKVRCVDFNGAGGCFIGQNCAPADGLNCTDIPKLP